MYSLYKKQEEREGGGKIKLKKKFIFTEIRTIILAFFLLHLFFSIRVGSTSYAMFKPSGEIDFNYVKYPDNPFARSTLNKFMILFCQISDTSDRIVATEKIKDILRKHNSGYWNELKDPELSTHAPPGIVSRFNKQKNLRIATKHLTVKMICDLPHPYSPDGKVEGQQFTDSSGTEWTIPDYCLKTYFQTKGEFTQITQGFCSRFSFGSERKSKEEITLSDLDIALEFIAYQLYVSFINVEEFGAMDLILDISMFPYLKAIVYLKNLPKEEKEKSLR